ncbi:PorP/SprF family type IX secretion system membrane protein [uncultured Polaribacter sp.]|uniref:PorP/SprF family type IX secretion system membrane protein n=1 Tax=uncultured Polaribacter sp. TaxID=174711 RepID=UPI0026364C6F|nr:PorP/SprF family type IX secretion system membrane protein [uncultured Polaribacter sp.]
MKKLGLLVFFLGAVLFVNAQSVGLADPMITAPLNAIENSVVGIKDGDAGFRFIESGGLEIPAQSAPGVANVTISVNFQRIKLTSDDVTSISGTLLNYFSANYNVANNILTFTQNAMIPADGFGDILFPISVIQNSTQAETLNGFEAIMSVSDPGINITGNRVARRTFTKTSLFAIDDPINVVDEDSNNNNIAVIGNDSFGTDGPSTTIPMTITIAPTNGTAFVNEGGTPNNPSDDFIVYTPNTNYNGTDTIEYEICDLSGFCDKATVTIMVNPILDPLNVPVNEVTPNVGAGIYYYTDKFYFGASAPNFLETRHLDKSLVSTASENTHFFVTSGYVFDLTDNLKFKPSTMLKGVAGAPLSVDINGNFLINEKFEIGLSHRLDDSVSGMLGFQVNKNFRVGYAYDHTITPFGEFNTGSHEIMLLFDFTKKQLKSPRFF